MVASPLARTMETAAAFGRPVEVDDRWVELDYGTLDGQPVGDVPAEVWREWRRDPDFVPGGGESLVALGRRSARRVRGAGRRSPGARRDRGEPRVADQGRGVVVLGVGDDVAWRMFVQIASIARVGFNQWGPSLHSFNEQPTVDDRP